MKRQFMKKIYPQTQKNKELTSITVKIPMMCLLVQLQKVIFSDCTEVSIKKYGEHREFSQY